VVLAFDADEAGAGAALRGFERSVPGDLDLRVATLPEGKDPAEVVAGSGADAMQKAVDESVPLLQFRIDAELAKYNLSEPEARTRAVRAVAAVIALHPDPVARHEYAMLVTRRTGVESRLVESTIRGASKESRNATRPNRADGPPVPQAPPPTETPAGPTHATEIELIRTMLANDERLFGAEVDDTLFTHPDTAAGYQVARDLIEGSAAGVPPNLGEAIGSSDDPVSQMLRRLAMDPKPVLDPVELVAHLRASAIERQISEIQTLLQQSDRAADEQGYSELLNRLVALQRDRKQLRRIE
jgi:DNA primase